MRIARIAFELMNRPVGWTFAGIERELSIFERTLLRNIAASQQDLAD